MKFNISKSPTGFFPDYLFWFCSFAAECQEKEFVLEERFKYLIHNLIDIYEDDEKEISEEEEEEKKNYNKIKNFVLLIFYFDLFLNYFPFILKK